MSDFPLCFFSFVFGMYMCRVPTGGSWSSLLWHSSVLNSKFHTSVGLARMDGFSVECVHSGQSFLLQMSELGHHTVGSIHYSTYKCIIWYSICRKRENPIKRHYKSSICMLVVETISTHFIPKLFHHNVVILLYPIGSLHLTHSFTWSWNKVPSLCSPVSIL